MKWNKFFMLGVAGLALCACSNEDEVTNTSLPTGEGAVTVRIVSPALTKSVAEGTGNVETVKVTGKLTITVTHTANDVNNSSTISKTIAITDGEPATSTVTFWNVTNPTKVEAVMHSGQASYSEISIGNTSTPNMQALPASIPVYGSAEGAEIVLTNNTNNGVANNTGDANAGANSDGEDPGRTFQMYTASVNLEIPVARLEMSGITHVDHTGSSCEFTDLQITGVYLDNLLLTGGAQSRSNVKYPDDTDAGSETNSPLYDAINPAESFVNGTTWPHDDSKTNPVFAYNFYAPDDDDASLTSVTEEQSAQYNPHFKVCFTCKESAGSATTMKRYAMIKKYEDSEGNALVMRRGHIYKITGGTISDDNIVPGEDGEDLYAITVTVTEATWEVETATGTWEGTASGDGD